MAEDSQTFDQYTQQVGFEKLTSIVSEEFNVAESLIEHNIPTYYLVQSQETKQAFLRLLQKLEMLNLMAFLRRSDTSVILRVVPKPDNKPSNVLVNWLLFLATIGTTFATGYMLSIDLIDPLIGGVTFMVAIMVVLGTHELGHMLSAKKEGMDATPPYFIPGPPPALGGIGTFGAVIMQKSLPPNKDALFDVGSSGPIVGFILAAIVTAVGATMAIPSSIPGEFGTLPTPLISILIGRFLFSLGMIPSASSGQRLFMHPVEVAGWVGMIVTMLNLLPAAMLDGGHIARSLAGEKTRIALTVFSILLLLVTDFWMMAIFVLFIATQKHPGPLDDVSDLSTSRKLMATLLVAVFLLCFPFF